MGNRETKLGDGSPSSRNLAWNRSGPRIGQLPHLPRTPAAESRGGRTGEFRDRKFRESRGRNVTPRTWSHCNGLSAVRGLSSVPCFPCPIERRKLIPDARTPEDAHSFCCLYATRERWITSIGLRCKVTLEAPLSEGRLICFGYATVYVEMRDMTTIPQELRDRTK
jgi:hypothetical protein